MRRRYSSIVFVIVGVGMGAMSIIPLQGFCQLPLGFSVWSKDSEKSDQYILAAPFYGDTNFEGTGTIQLIDTQGVPVHTWWTPHPVLSAYLSPDGTVTASMTPPLDSKDYPSPGGTTGLIQKIDWDGNVLWEYRDNRMALDFEILPDGRIMYIRWHPAPESFARDVRGGMDTATTSVWTNELVVVNAYKQIEWTWKFEDHVDPRSYTVSPLVPKVDWAHMNSVRYIVDNPITHTPAYLVSVRHISTVFMIDTEDGAILWESPRGMFSLQHDATLTKSGTILVFDNGLFRDHPVPAVISRVVEIDPRKNSVVWEFTGGKSGLEKVQYSSSIMGGAQRLDSGNTLITVSMMNDLYEVTSEGEIVWKYSNDFRDADNRMYALFKVRAYDAANTAWGSRVSRNSLGHWKASMCQR